MKIVYNNIIPFSGYKAINLFGILFIKKKYKINNIDINHEAIHSAQMKELFYIFFYLIYVIEWIIRLFMKGNAYRNISFEKEAYNNEYDLNYLSSRKRFAMWRKLHI